MDVWGDMFPTTLEDSFSEYALTHTVLQDAEIDLPEQRGSCTGDMVFTTLEDSFSEYALTHTIVQDGELLPAEQINTLATGTRVDDTLVSDGGWVNTFLDDNASRTMQLNDDILQLLEEPFYLYPNPEPSPAADAALPAPDSAKETSGVAAVNDDSMTGYLTSDSLETVNVKRKRQASLQGSEKRSRRHIMRPVLPFVDVLPTDKDLEVLGIPGAMNPALLESIPVKSVGSINLTDPGVSRGFLPPMLELLHPWAMRQHQECYSELEMRVPWSQYLSGARLMIFNDNGKLNLWMGEHKGVDGRLRKRWLFTACSKSSEPVPDRISATGTVTQKRGYYTGEGTMNTDSFGRPFSNGNIHIDNGRFNTAYTCRTAIVITYIEMVRMLERTSLDSFKVDDPWTWSMFSSITMNTATKPYTKDLIASAVKHAIKISEALPAQ